VCTLFPFNAFHRVGGVLAVSPNFLCPLRIRVPPEPGNVAGTHGIVERDVAASMLIDEQSWLAMPRPTLPAGARPTDVITRERLFRDACGAALGSATFRHVLDRSSADPGELWRRTGQAAHMLRLPLPPERSAPDALDNVLLAIAAPFRLRMLVLPAESILLALAVGELLLREAQTLGREPVTAQSAVSFLSNVAPALRVLAATDVPGEMPHRLAPIPPFGDADTTAAARRLLAYLAAGQDPLDACEAATADLPPETRLALLVEVGGMAG
jgi:hypothetical protein